MRTKSQRYIDALAQLPQFMVTVMNSYEEGRVIDAQTGAVVHAVPDPEGEEHDFIEVTFPGGQPFQVIGPLYLRLQIVEAARHYEASSDEGRGPIAKRTEQLLEHLSRKHDLE